MNRMVYVLLLLLLSGCAVGNKYDYRSSDITLPVRSAGAEKVILAVEDARTYVLSANKSSKFVGLQRGGFGNPFDVTTASGNPLAEDMSVAISKALTEAGYQVFSVKEAADEQNLVKTATQNGAKRIVTMKIREWKSDIYMSINIHCDIDLRVYDASGKLLAENNMKFVEEIGGALIGGAKNSKAVSDEFAKRIGYLFNKKEIRDSL